jgi:hypothetical protein
MKVMNHSKYHFIVIVLCNKVDDPEDAELIHRVREMTDHVETIFEVGDRGQAGSGLNQMYGRTNTPGKPARGRI